MMKAELTQGIGTTGIKAGVIKVGSSLGTITPYEEMFFRAAARVQHELGTVILTHTEGGTMGPEQADLLLREGGDPARIVIGHMCGNTDPDYAVRVLDQGVFIALDRFGLEADAFHTPKDTEREALAMALISRGYTGQLLFSQDTVNMNLGRKVRWPAHMAQAMEAANIERIFQVILPDLLRLGATQEQLDTILMENPARLFG